MDSPTVSTSFSQEIDPIMMSTPIKHKRLEQLQSHGSFKSPGTLKIPASPMMTRLGYGTGVGVYLMERSPKPCGEIRSPWAIKKIAALSLIRKENKIYVARLEHEACILKKLDHPNIIGYRIFSKPEGNGMGAYLALEKASSSLADIIENRFDEFIQLENIDPNPFPSKNIEKVGLDIAKALHYLHEDKKMIHGDIKSGNVLIFGDFEIAKLCDFGVSRKLKDDGTVEGFYVGTEIWNPKEIMDALSGNDVNTRYPITQKVDIYPYGLTLFEMISLKPPHISTNIEGDNQYLDCSYDETGSNIEKSFDDSLYEEQLAQRIGTRPSLPDIEFDESYNKILEVFYCCTEEDPSKRPYAKDIITLLESNTNSQQEVNSTNYSN